MRDSRWFSARRLFGVARFVRRRASPRLSPLTRPPSLAVETLEGRDVPTTVTPAYLFSSPVGQTTPQTSSSPYGLTPSAIRHAYGFDQITFSGITGDGSGQTIAIVDAGGDTSLANDLHQFDLQYNLPDPTLTMVNQTGGSTMPAAVAGWGVEISLDVEWAHAVAPKATILYVGATTADDSNMYVAVDYASKSGASVVSMSWGDPEDKSETGNDYHFTAAGVTYLASSGDSGAPPIYPSVSPNVVAVGGTTLSLNADGSYKGESAWSGSGGGISSAESQPSYQKGVTISNGSGSVSANGMRTTPDVADDADVNTGVSVYDSGDFGTTIPWVKVGGTSASAPMWAGLIAVADQGRLLNGLGTLSGASQALPALYSLPGSDFHDVTTGSTDGSTTYSAGTGYDLTTGLGSPIGNLVASGLARYGLSTWTGWTAVTGLSNVSAPVIANQADGVHEIGVIGPNGYLWMKFADDKGNSTSWYDLGGACVSIAATTNNVGLVDIFASFANGQVWEFAHNKSGFSWIDLGGSAAGPIAAATESGGAEQVCSVGTDGGLWVRWVDAEGNSTGWADVGGSCKSVAASRNGAGLVDAFAVFTDGTLHEFAHRGNGSFTWVSLGGSLAGPIAVGLESGGAEQIAAVGSDGGLWLRWVDSLGDSTGWADVGSGVKSVAVATNSAGLVDTFVTLSDGTVGDYAHVNASTFSWVVGLGGSVKGLAATTNSAGDEILLAAALDGSLWIRTQTSPGSW